MIVDSVLQHAQNPNTKFFGLQLLDDAVNVSFVLLNFGLDSLANFEWREQSGDQDCSGLVSTLFSWRHPDARAELIFADQAQCYPNFDCQVRMEDDLAELHSRDLCHCQRIRKQMRKCTEHPQIALRRGIQFFQGQYSDIGCSILKREFQCPVWWGLQSLRVRANLGSPKWPIICSSPR